MSEKQPRFVAPIEALIETLTEGVRGHPYEDYRNRTYQKRPSLIPFDLRERKRLEGMDNH